jgi:hypothetical protein
MTTSFVGNVSKIEAPSTSSLPTVGGKTTIKARLNGLWPPVVIGFGLVLTVAWAAGLLWLLHRVVWV